MLDLPPDLPLIHVDPVLVQQALVQIFDNAVKYSDAGLADQGCGADAATAAWIISVSRPGRRA